MLVLMQSYKSKSKVKELTKNTAKSTKITVESFLVIMKTKDEETNTINYRFAKGIKANY